MNLLSNFDRRDFFFYFDFFGLVVCFVRDGRDPKRKTRGRESPPSRDERLQKSRCETDVDLDGRALVINQ